MRSLPTQMLTELAGGTDGTNAIAYLVDLFLPAETVRLTDSDIDIRHEGVWYRSRSMAFGETGHAIGPTAESVTIEIDNVDLLVSGWLQGIEIRGRRWRQRLVALNAHAQVVGSMIVFDGIVDSGSADRRTGTLRITSHMIWWQRRIPRRDHAASCPWTYRDPVTCRYTGAAPDCDKSWEQCQGRANSINFGGFRWLPALQQRQIWWGRVPR